MTERISLESGKVELNKPTMEDVTQQVSVAMYCQQNANWWMGDLILYAINRWQDTGWQCVDPAYHSREHIDRVVGVSRSIPPDRRRTELSWSHHQMVSKLPPQVQDQFLEQAVENGWTSGMLRDFVSTYKRGSSL